MKLKQTKGFYHDLINLKTYAVIVCMCVCVYAHGHFMQEQKKNCVTCILTSDFNCPHKQ